MKLHATCRFLHLFSSFLCGFNHHREKVTEIKRSRVLGPAPLSECVDFTEQFLILGRFPTPGVVIPRKIADCFTSPFSER